MKNPKYEYRNPKQIRNTNIEIRNPDESLTIESRIDVLILEQNLWVLVIESERAELSLRVELAQILSHMLANPVSDRPCFGLITNGGTYLFLKLAPGDPPAYGMSKVFDLLNPGKDLYQVLEQIVCYYTRSRGLNEDKAQKLSLNAGKALSVRATRASCTRFSAIARAMAFPMPLLAPVTTAVLFLSFILRYKPKKRKGMKRKNG